MSTTGKFDEATAIANYWTDTIYPNEFKDGSGKYFNIVMDANGDHTVEYSPPYPSRNKIKLTVSFIKSNNDIKEVTIKQFKEYNSKGVSRWEEQSFGPDNPIRFTHFSFVKLLGFLKLLTELNLVNLNQRRIALRENADDHLDDETQAKMRSLMQQPDGQALIVELLNNGSITSKDLVNIGYRRKQLSVFKGLISGKGIEDYRQHHRISSQQHEKILQHFFKENPWIFGFGLDYRYLSILQDEANISHEDVAGHDGAKGDFLLGATNFTVLVELKLPSTPIFSSRRNRAGSWRLSNELMDSTSQILEQKAGWQVKSDSRDSSYDVNGKSIAQRTIDPKCLLIIGSSDQFNGTEKEKNIKLRTFELFRRDSRNIEILTYDELYERADFLVNQKNANKNEVDQAPF